MSFYLSGLVGIVFGIYWLIVYRDPQHSSKVNDAELDIIRKGGGHGSVNQQTGNGKVNWLSVKYILRQRTTWGLFIAQFAASSTLYFFLTWFIVYLEKGLHLSIDKAGIGAMFPYLMAMAGVLCGGTLSDFLLKRGRSRTFARKLPVMLGMLLTCSIALVNFFQDSPVIAIAILSIAFFANAFSNLGWVVCSDVIPRHLIGTIGGFLNIFGNLSGIVSPIIIGVILQRTHNFQYAMWYIAAVALMGFLAYLLLVGKIEVMTPPGEQPAENKKKFETPSNA
jgi:ACS family D-galactonate transporter-like MFS transporter